MADIAAAPPSTPAAPAVSSPSSSSSSAPATPSTPATQSSTPATPTAPAVPSTPSLPEGKSTLEIVKDLSTKAIADSKKPAEAVATPPAEPAKPPEVKPPDAAAKPADPPKAEDKPSDAPPAAEVEEDIIPPEDLTLQEMGLLSPIEYGALLKENPDLKTFLDAHPEINSKLGFTLRKATDFAKVAAAGITTERQAKFVMGQTQLMADIESNLTSLTQKDDKGADGYTRLVGIMGALDLVRDDETGEPVKDAQGNYARHGFVDQFLVRTGTELLNSLEAEAEASQDPTLLAAVRTVKERITRTSSASDDELPEHLKAEQQRIQADKQQLDREKLKAKADKRNQVETAAREQSLKDLNGAIGKFLGRTALEEFAKEVVIGRARTAFFERLEKDSVFKQQRDYLLSQPQTKEVLAERRALVREKMSEYLPGIMRTELKRAGATEVARQSDADRQRQAQEKQSRHDIQGAPPLPAAPPNESSEAQMARIESAFVEQNHRRPTMRELVTLVNKETQARRAGAPR